MVYSIIDVDVLLIIEIRDKVLITVLLYLMPDSRLLKVHVQASKQIQQICQEYYDNNNNNNKIKNSNNSKLNLIVLNYYLSLIFNNDIIGNKAVKRFIE